MSKDTGVPADAAFDETGRNIEKGGLVRHI